MADEVVDEDGLEVGEFPVDRLEPGDIVLGEFEEFPAPSQVIPVDSEFPDHLRNGILGQ